MYSTASFTVAIFSASSSGISMPKFSSKAMTSSTVSRESAPRSSTKEAVGVTSPSSTPSCSTMIVFTRSSTLAILIFPPVSAIYFAPQVYSDRERPKTACPFYARCNAGSTLGAQNCNSSRICELRLPLFGQKKLLAHVQAAVDVEDLAGDVAGFVAGEEGDGGGDVAVGAEAAERDHRLHFVFQFLRERIGHGRGDEA